MSLRFAFAALLCLLSLAAFGCGDDEDAGAGSTAAGGVIGATGSTGKTGDSGATGSKPASEQDCPPTKKKPSFDVKLIIGLPADEAESVAADNGYSMRAIWVDGEPRAATMDYNPKRLNVAVRDGEVTQLCDIG